MVGIAEQPSDDQLWLLLDIPHPWLVRTDSRLLRPQRSLREALWQARDTIAEGVAVRCIMKLPEGEITIEPLQARRLMLRLSRRRE